MDVRDQSKAIDQARDRYREAQEELRASYDKNLNQMKETFDAKTEKQSKTYAEHKAKLEEDNQVNNELYTEKTRSAINRGQQEFKERLRENVNRFEAERNKSKADLNEKLTNISDSYKKSFDENNRYQDQIKKSMQERYSNANKNYQEDFNRQVKNLDENSRQAAVENRENDRKDRMNLMAKHSEELENLRSSASEQKFKEVSTLRNDNENLRTTMSRENQLLKDRQEERVADLFKMKDKEAIDGQKNYEDLQKNIRQKNLEAQEKQNIAHKKESKELEKRFNDDMRNIQRVAAQKVKGGTQADTLHDELKQTKNSYENRLQAARNEITRNNQANTEKEELNDASYREKLKQVKMAGVENLAKKDAEATEALNETIYQNRERNNALMERYKTDTGAMKKESDDRLSHVTQQSNGRMKEQRVEFGRVVNAMNEKNMDTINALKDDYSKDKTFYIEKSKKDFNEEKVSMKNDFNRQNSIKESLYEQKLAEMEKNASKIIENYENRISQIARKAENEVEAVKRREESRTMKEAQANKLAFDTLQKQNENELAQVRDKYEGVIAKNQIMNEVKTNNLVQKYEDQLNRERSENQKEMSVRLGEARAQFERLHRSSELEKETLRNQYEQRMENMRLSSLAQENSKKA